MLLDKAESPWSGHRAPTPGKIARFNTNDECDDSGRGVLVALFGREVPELTGDRADFEALFDRFETLAVLSCAHPADVMVSPLPASWGVFRVLGSVRTRLG